MVKWRQQELLDLQKGKNWCVQFRNIEFVTLTAEAETFNSDFCIFQVNGG